METLENIYKRYEMKDVLEQTISGIEIQFDGYITVILNDKKEEVDKAFNKLLEHRKVIVQIAQYFHLLTDKDKEKISDEQMKLIKKLQENPNLKDSIEVLEEGRLEDGRYYKVFSNEIDIVLNR